VQLLGTAYTPDQLPKTALPEIVLAGRSNVGKSLLVNRLAGLSAREARRQGAKISSRPGCTRSVNYYRLWPGAILVDLPGYGFADLPPVERRRLRALMDAFWASKPPVAAILHVADARLPLQPGDWQMLEWGKHFGFSYLLALNKCDKLARSAILRRTREAVRDLKRANYAARVVGVSAASGLGVKELRKWLTAAVDQRQRGGAHVI